MIISCVICKRDGTVLLVKGVPTQGCATYGEEYGEEEASPRLLKAA
jgi:hypothetical protein